MPLEHIPCSVVSNAHFRGRGFTNDGNSEAEYFELIKSWDGNRYNLEKAKTLARRYAYLSFERYQLPFRFFHKPKRTDVSAMNFDFVQSLATHPVVKLIYDSIENGDDFLLPAFPQAKEKFKQ